jgi:hypothetical protein
MRYWAVKLTAAAAGQYPEPGGRVAQPQTGPVLESSGQSGLIAVAGPADQRYADRAE